jgi:phage regulator Rha-like protein
MLVLNTTPSTAAMTMTSREIAELTGKNHADVLRDIRNMLDALEVGQSSFADSYVNLHKRRRGRGYHPRPSLASVTPAS